MSAAMIVSFLWPLLLLMGNHALELTTDDNLSIPEEDTPYPDIDYTATNTYLEESITSTTDISARTISVKDVFEDTSKEDRGIKVIKNWLKGDEDKGHTAEKAVLNLTQADLQIINEIVEDVYAEVVKKNATLLEGQGKGVGEEQDKKGHEITSEDVGAEVQQDKAKKEEENHENKNEDVKAEDNVVGVHQETSEDVKEESEPVEYEEVIPPEDNRVRVQQGATKEEGTGVPEGGNEGVSNKNVKTVKLENDKVDVVLGYEEEDNKTQEIAEDKATINEDKEQVGPEDYKVEEQPKLGEGSGEIVIPKDGSAEISKGASTKENVDLEETRPEDKNTIPQESISTDEQRENNADVELNIDKAQLKGEEGSEHNSGITMGEEKDSSIVPDANKEEGDDDFETIEKDMEMNGQVNSVKILKEDDDMLLQSLSTTGPTETVAKNEDFFAVQQNGDLGLDYKAKYTPKPDFKEEDVSTPVGDFINFESKLEDQDMVESSKIEDAVSNEDNLVVLQTSENYEDAGNNLEDTGISGEDPVLTVLKNEENTTERDTATTKDSLVADMILETPNIPEVDSPVMSNPQPIGEDLVGNEVNIEEETEPYDTPLISQSIEDDLTTEVSQEDEGAETTEKVFLGTFEGSKVNNSNFVNELEKDLTESIQLLKHELENKSSEEASTSKTTTLPAEMKGVTTLLKTTQDEAMENFENSSLYKDDNVSKNFRNAREHSEEKGSSAEVDQLEVTFSDSNSIGEEDKLSAESLKATPFNFEQLAETSTVETSKGPTFEYTTSVTSEVILSSQEENKPLIFSKSTTVESVKDSLDGSRQGSELKDKIEAIKKLDFDRNAAIESLQGFLGGSSSSLNAEDLDGAMEEDDRFGESSEDLIGSTTVGSILGGSSQSTSANTRGSNEDAITSGSFFKESIGDFDGSSMSLKESTQAAFSYSVSTTVKTLPSSNYLSDDATLKTLQDIPDVASTDQGEDTTVGSTLFAKSTTFKSLQGSQSNDVSAEDSEEFKASVSLVDDTTENEEINGGTQGSSNVDEGSGRGEDNGAKDVGGLSSTDNQGSNFSEEDVASQGSNGVDDKDNGALNSNSMEEGVYLGEDKNLMMGESSHGQNGGRKLGADNVMDGESQGGLNKRPNIDKDKDGLGGTQQILYGKDTGSEHKGAIGEEGQKNNKEIKDPALKDRRSHVSSSKTEGLVRDEDKNATDRGQGSFIKGEGSHDFKDVTDRTKQGLHGEDGESVLGEDETSLESYQDQDSLSEDSISTKEESQDSNSEDAGSNLGEDKDGAATLDHLKAFSTANDSYPKELHATLYVAPSGHHQDSGDQDQEKSEDVEASYSSDEHYEEQTTEETKHSEFYDSTGEESALSATNEENSEDYTYEEEQSGQIVVTDVPKSKIDQGEEIKSSTLRGLPTQNLAKNTEATSSTSRSSRQQGDLSGGLPLEEAGINGNSEVTTSSALMSLEASQEKADSASYEEDELQDQSSISNAEQGESSQSQDELLEFSKNTLDDTYLASREDDSASYDNNYLEGESLSEQEEEDSNSLQGRHFKISGKIRNRNEDVCMLLNLSATVQIEDVTKTVPPTSEVYGNCTLDGQHVRIVWRELDAPDCNNSLYLVFNKDSSAHRLIAVEVRVYDSHRKELVHRLKENLDLTVEDGDEILTSKKIIFDDIVSLEFFNLAVMSPSKGIIASSVKNKNLLALQIASGCTTLLIVALVFVIYIYKKVKNKARVFKVALDT